ncbi:hypothetical protein OHA72_05775 [Dactylosporangium sp. NBC_01737]|uniref:hypothetical protein n=1 Tax=Dactylosporangium sp. NBC_01737 TaxID=2975959 RepID=UPI002E0D6A30|nr:hypothetical protein OHA72_05775 [Dactylosporangium sp. NBC_01737]
MSGRPWVRDPARLDDPGNWAGGFYELDIELGPVDPVRLQQDLSGLWSAARVEGCHAHGGEWPAVPLTVGELAARGHLAGVVLVPSGERVVCGVVGIDYGDGGQWLSFHVPLGALGRVEHRVGGFPFDGRSGVASLQWRRPIDGWLAGVAGAVHREVGIACALIGFEVDAGVDAASLGGGVPAQRWETILLPGPGGLVAHPANQ